MFGAVAARQERHPVAREDPVKCTPQLGRPGPWWDRLPHFRMQYKPSVGQELQSEYLIPRRHAVAALEAVQSMADTIRPALQISEIRTIAVDDLWLSPQYAEDTLAIHFTWVPDESRVQRVLPDLEQRLEAFEARPHWGKLFAMSAPDIAHLYPRVSDFRQLRDSMDPRGALRNAWFERHFGT
jgi:xylitol oxidase